MSKEEWINVLNSAYDKAQKDFLSAEFKTQEEEIARFCMRIFNYLIRAIKESNEK